MRMWDVGSRDMEHGAMGCRTVKVWGLGTTGPGSMVLMQGWGRAGCWGSRSGGCVTWTRPGSAACPTTPSPAWTAWAGPLPLDTTSGMARTRMAQGCALPGMAPVPMSPCPRRHARYYRWPNGSERRTLIKAFGIRFDVLVYGSVCVGPGGSQGGHRGAGDSGQQGRGLRPTSSAPPGREVWHCPHPHQHGGRFHLHRCGELWMFSAPEW